MVLPALPIKSDTAPQCSSTFLTAFRNYEHAKVLREKEGEK